MISCGEMTSAPEVTQEQRIDSVQQIESRFKTAYEAENFTEALSLAEQENSISDRIAYSEGQAEGLLNKSNVLFRQGIYADALAEAVKAQSVFELMNDNAGQANSLYQMSLLYARQGNYTEAIASGEQALALHEQLKDNEAISRDLNGLGINHVYAGKYTVAKTFFAERVGMERANGDSLRVAEALEDFGIACTEGGDSEQGLEYHRQALTAMTGLDMSAEKNVRLASLIKLNMAGEYFLQNDYGEAIRCGEEALRLARQINDMSIASMAYQRLAEIYGLTGREDIQLQYMEVFTRMSDSIRTADYSKRIAELEMQQALAENENEIALATAEIKVQEEKQKNKVLIIGLFIASGLGLVFLITLIVIAVSKSRQNRNYVQ